MGGVYDANEQNNPGRLLVQTVSEDKVVVVPFTIEGKDYFLAVTLSLT